jgi:hypothetical protein
MDAVITLVGSPKTGSNAEAGLIVADAAGAFINFSGVTFVGASGGGTGWYSANGGGIDTGNNGASITGAPALYSAGSFADSPGNRGNFA